MRRMVLAVLLLLLAACAPVVAPPGPRTSAPALSADGFLAADGTVLPVRAWMPKGSPRAVIVALHGFNDYHNFFAMPGEFLAGKGFAAYAYDQRGFGDSPNRGLWPGVLAYAHDLNDFVKEVRVRHPGVPLFLLGESMGGAVAISAMTGENRPSVDGVILSAPAVWGRKTMPFYQAWTLWLGAHVMPWAELTGKSLRIKASDNIEMLRALGRDPKIIKATRIDAIYGLAGLMDEALEKARRLEAPVLILYGEKDEIIPKEPTYKMLKSFSVKAMEKTTVAVYENGYHMLLRDLQAETVWRDIAAWIADPALPLPSGADGRAMVVLAGRQWESP